MCHQRDFPIWIRPVVRKAEKGVKKMLIREIRRHRVQ